ncbi:hypothetical protein Pint_19660 [Pistacia integerrima]|uniref:Uncharacterized protein n=1 Tax=Pistacia integerrima TaxID=434235 RepID=A0ACC0XET5_9ROSI|nr:hypothetical protein Pint_19660 [Pistacia integerrima]
MWKKNLFLFECFRLWLYPSLEMAVVFMNGLNHVQVYGVEKLHDALLHRPKNRPLITL